MAARFRKTRKKSLFTSTVNGSRLLREEKVVEGDEIVPKEVPLAYGENVIKNYIGEFKFSLK